MQVICELSKEFISLPADEAEMCFSAEGFSPLDCFHNEDVFTASINASSNELHSVVSRLALSYNVGRILCTSLPNATDLLRRAQDISLPAEGTMAIRYRNRSTSIASQKIIKPLAEMLTKNRSVDLNCPDVKIRVIIRDDKIYVMQLFYHIDRSAFEKRKAQYRPFFSPISLHPKLARALVNLSGINRSQQILDPFCGTGGFLLEAGLIGASILGCDIDEKMISGSEKMLKYYGINDFQLLRSDVGNITNHFNQVAAIVTDLPYGKSTTTRGEDMQQLASRAFDQFSQVLKKDGTAVVGSHSPEILQLGANVLMLHKVYSIPVHQSLTRYFGIFKPHPKSF